MVLGRLMTVTSKSVLAEHRQFLIWKWININKIQYLFLSSNISFCYVHVAPWLVVKYCVICKYHLLFQCTIIIITRFSISVHKYIQSLHCFWKGHVTCNGNDYNNTVILLYIIVLVIAALQLTIKSNVQFLIGYEYIICMI